ncbi:hypothetical protein [Lysobacter sp. Root916]|uniref:hypothetical protein n=1 Tax=Lysobacter sp. Root916 TaxID=1736606 RepID=UPI000B2E928E|nr:hypothetical protein [Lysobacter sp. Root916]
MASRVVRSAVLDVGLTFSLLFVSAVVGAQTPTAATAAPLESDAARVVRYTRALETSPDSAEARELRQWLTKWADETPDYVVNVCDVLDLVKSDGDTVPNTSELLLQSIYGNAAFQVENGAKSDELSKQVAAVESTLRAYAAFLAKDAKARAPHLDALIAKRDAGRLRAYLAPIVEKKCDSASATDGPVDASRPSKQPFLGGFLRESHVVYPLKVEGWEMRGEQRYDTQEAGASVRFQRAGDKQGWIDVYFYPVGVLTDAEVAQMAGVERQNLLDAWGKTMTGPQDMTALKAFAVPIQARAKGKATHGAKADDITVYAVDFAYVRDGKALSSAMMFAVDRMYAIKFRYSAEAAKHTRAQLRQDLEQFAQSMLPRLQISSTGNCWSPPPIEALAKDAKPPEKALVTSSLNGVAVAWVLPGRVVARDPSHPTAADTQAIALSLQGRLYDGCASAEPLLPDVKDGMRELRFEYGTGKSAPVERPLRIQRSGAG